MAKVFISFLGTNDYLHCNYYYPTEGNKVENVRFVQEAIVQLVCKDFGEQDRLMFFVTKEAEKKNWLDNGHTDRNGAALEREGLATRLSKLHLPCRIEKHSIDSGFNSQEVWSIFEIVFKELNQGDMVTFDITHAFRSIPVLGMVLMNYAKSLKDIIINDIHYGAFEALGPVYKVREMGVKDRNAEIVSLKTFSILQDWTNAANEFIQTGRTSGIQQLIQPHSLRQIIEHPDEYTLQRFSQFAEALYNMSMAMSTVRGYEIMKGRIFRHVNNIVNELKKKNYLAPLQPVLERIGEQTKAFKYTDKQSILNTLQGVKWCIETDLIQQGITLLQEAVITYVMIYFEDELQDKSYRIFQHRNIIKSAIVYVNDPTTLQKRHGKYKGDVQTIQTLHGKNKKIFQELSKLMMVLTYFRNDINHGGFEMGEKMRKAHKFKPELEKDYKKVKKILKQYPL